MNEELLEMDRDKIPKDPKSRRIYELETLIKKFKRYDADRTRLLNKIQNDLEDYSEKYMFLKSALSENEKFQKLTEQIKGLKANLKAVSIRHDQLKKEMELVQNTELMEKAHFILQHYDVVNLHERCERLDKEVGRLRASNNELVMRIVQLNKQLNKQNNENQSKMQ